MEITVESIVFLIFGVITLGGALLVVSSRNLFHAGLYLMVSLFGVAGLFVLLAAPFLAGVQLVVYIGAIAILIMLAIMLTPEITHMPGIFSQQWPASLVVAAIEPDKLGELTLRIDRPERGSITVAVKRATCTLLDLARCTISVTLSL